MKDIAKMGITLLLFSAIAAGVLAFVNNLTAPVIAENQKQASYKSYFEIYEGGETEVTDFAEIDEEILGQIQEKYSNITDVLMAVNGEETVGYVMDVKSNGYGGEMSNAVVINADGTFQGFRNLANGETPGFGKAVEDADFYTRFDGKSAIEGEIVAGSGADANSIEAISGSTISTTAILKGVNEVVSAFNEFFFE